LGGHTGISI